jgi:titin
MAPIVLAGCEDVTEPVAEPATFHITPGRPFTVNTRDDIDNGFCSYRHCSLREAINAANAKPGPDRIVFRIPGIGVRTIQPLSQLPTIRDSVVIDGYTQRGSSPNTNPPELGTNAVVTIELDGTKAGSPWINGLFINASGTMVRGLAINRFSGNGIYIYGTAATANLLQGNFIGTDAAGTADLGNGINGVLIAGFATDNLVGGSAPEARNLISGNEFSGVNIFSASNVVQGNLIGTDATGTKKLANVRGVVLQHAAAARNLIGGTTPGERNVISGNDQRGVLILHVGATGNVVRGNYIGTDVSGTTNLGNTLSGVAIFSGASNNVIGGLTQGARNIISGNGLDGVRIQNEGTTGNLVQGNYIGTDVTGTMDLGNLGGVLIQFAAANNLIGGPTSAARNVISGNDFAGVNIFSSDNTVQGNFIGTNATGDGILTNTVVGITIQTGAEGNLIGGTEPGAGNVISGNGNWNEGGLTLITGARMNEALGNYIGTDATGVLDLGNNGPGVYIVSDASDNTISGNTVAFNRRHGFRVLSGVRNTIRANSIYSNTGLGIDLNDDGVTPNDPSDADTGPNDLLNFPRLMAAEGTDERLRVLGDIDTPDPQTVIVELFANLVPSPGGDPTGHGEGALFLGTAVPDSRGVFLAKLSPVPVGTLISATATNAQGSTSEFSANIVVKAPRI